MPIFGAGGMIPNNDDSFDKYDSEGIDVLVGTTFEDSLGEFVKRFNASKGSVNKLVERLEIFEDLVVDCVESNDFDLVVTGIILL